MRTHIAAAVTTLGLASALVGLAPAASARPMVVNFTNDCNVGAPNPNNGSWHAVCPFEVDGGVGTITVSAVATNWGPITTVFDQSRYPHYVYGPCTWGTYDSVQVTAQDSTGATASKSISFRCVLPA